MPEMNGHEHGGGIYQHLKYSASMFREGRAKRWESQRDYSKLLIGLASSSLVLSVTLIKALANPGARIEVDALLGCVWITEILSIGLCMVALWLSTKLDQIDLIPDVVHARWIDNVAETIALHIPDEKLAAAEAFTDEMEAIVKKYEGPLFEIAEDHRNILEAKIDLYQRWVARLIAMGSAFFLASLAVLMVWAIQR